MALAAMLTLSSCNSLFDEAPEDKLTDESIWTTENLLDEYTMAWYSNMNIPKTYSMNIPWHGTAI